MERASNLACARTCFSGRASSIRGSSFESVAVSEALISATAADQRFVVGNLRRAPSIVPSGHAPHSRHARDALSGARTFEACRSSLATLSCPCVSGRPAAARSPGAPYRCRSYRTVDSTGSAGFARRMQGAEPPPPEGRGPASSRASWNTSAACRRPSQAATRAVVHREWRARRVDSGCCLAALS